MASRMIEKSQARVREAVAGELAPGEEIEVLLFGITRLNFWLDVLIAPLLSFFQRMWYVVLTDQRVLLVRLNRWSGRPAGIEWIEPRAGVRVDRYAPGKLLGKLFLRRVSNGVELKLHFNFRNRAEAIAVKTVLGD
jgi:hypothetical protein